MERRATPDENTGHGRFECGKLLLKPVRYRLCKVTFCHSHVSPAKHSCPRLSKGHEKLAGPRTTLNSPFTLALSSLLTTTAGSRFAGAPAEMLFDYANAPDPTFDWKKGPSKEVAGGSLSDIVLTSQMWRGMAWKHLLRIARPAQVSFPGWMGLLIGGGSGEPKPGEERKEDVLAMGLARSVGAPVAMLSHVPNQPLFGGMIEDEIISHTFQQYLKDGDPTWPLLFPMVKSALRAMDALQEHAKQEWQEKICGFVVFGASKRGWTTWLTAAVDGGRRVKAIAPAVIDVLNMPKQMKHQLEMWGSYSEQISDYSSKGLTESFSSRRGKALWQAVDPYSYRKIIAVPKLIILGSNDRYWTTDALNLYWDGLVGPKYVLYVPNAGHSLEPGMTRVLNTLSAFFRTVAGGDSMPEISWMRKARGDTLTLTIKAKEAKRGRAWVAKADSMDFRPERWEPVEMASEEGVLRVTIERPADKNVAVFGEADFERDGKPFTLSTQPAILKK